MPAIPKDAWFELKSYLLEGGGSRDARSIAMYAYKALQANEQKEFMIAMFRLFRASLLQFPDIKQ